MATKVHLNFAKAIQFPTIPVLLKKRRHKPSSKIRLHW